MNQAERKIIDNLRLRIEQLIRGEVVMAMEPPKECDDTVRSLADTFNLYILLRNETINFVDSLAQGNLEVTPPPRNQIAAPYKQLHASLQHMTWQTRQVAQGDYSQRVHFLGGFSDAFNSMVEALAEKERTEAALQDVRSQVKHLEGIIPICMCCKKIRDDGNSWQQLEIYISNHSEAKFSHGICPVCMKKHYGAVAARENNST